jgi:hypothetical protein
LPERPYNQVNRIAIMASGAIAGMILGLLILGFFEYRDLTLRREDDVIRILSLPVLALVPEMRSPRERRVCRFRTVAANAAAGVALLGAVAVVVAWRLQFLGP